MKPISFNRIAGNVRRAFNRTPSPPASENAATGASVGGKKKASPASSEGSTSAAQNYAERLSAGLRRSSSDGNGSPMSITPERKSMSPTRSGSSTGSPPPTLGMPEFGPSFEFPELGIASSSSATGTGKASAVRPSPLSVSTSSSAEVPLTETRKRGFKALGESALEKIAKFTRPRGGRSLTQTRPVGTTEATGSGSTSLLQLRPSSTTSVSAVASTSAIESASEVRAANAKKITDSLKTAVADPHAKILVVGYSPTGGGHTARLLNVVDHAIRENTLTRGSTVIFHVPSKWNNHDRPGQLSTLSHRLTDHGVNVIYAEADKSVQGFLQDSGASADDKIINRFAQHPNRKPADLSSVTDAKIFSGEHGEFQTVPSISAKDLIGSLKEITGDEAMASKVLVLTDMDHALQKAAMDHGVPGTNRVDQQNHAILLNLDDIQANLKPEFGLLSKVLGGTGERVSHIGLGDKNTLLPMRSLANKLGIRPETTKLESRNLAVNYMIAHGHPAVRSSPDQERRIEGILHHPSIQSADDVKNVKYIYAHQNQNSIFDEIKAKIDAGHEDYKDNFYVFCGPKAVKGANAMHLSYLADADGITTNGAGTNGEFAYLHRSGDAKAGLLALPIKGHNEQEANAQYLATHPATQTFVTVRADTSNIGQSLDVYHQERRELAREKYASGTMEKMLTAVGDESSYVKQTHDMLFRGVTTEEGLRIAEIEQAMRDNPVLEANRQFYKLAHQVLDETLSVLQATGPQMQTRSLKFKSTQKAPPRAEFATLKEFTRRIGSDVELTKILGSPVPLSAREVAFLTDSRTYFKDISHAMSTGANMDIEAKIHEWKEAYGEAVTTGF